MKLALYLKMAKNHGATHLSEAMSQMRYYGIALADIHSLMNEYKYLTSSYTVDGESKLDQVIALLETKKYKEKEFTKEEANADF